MKILARLPEAEFRVGKWDPFAFIAFCERARMQPGSVQERAALQIQTRRVADPVRLLRGAEESNVKPAPF